MVEKASEYLQSIKDKVSSGISSYKEKRIEFLLLNKDVPVLRFDYVEESPIDAYFEEVSIINDSMLPYAFEDVETWVRMRKAPKHRKHIKELADEFGCSSDVGYLQVAHGVSLNDTYWVRRVDENLTWGEVSPYTNEFNDVIAQYAFQGKLSGISLGQATPEFSTDGTYPKCWIREGGTIRLCKAGSDTYGALEPQLECAASRVYERLCKDAVHYDLSTQADIVVSKCDLFTSEEYGFVNMARIYRQSKVSVAALLELCTKYEGNGLFRRMLIADAIVLNVDRHLGNVGFLIENSTQRVCKVAPVFDYNRALVAGLTQGIYEDRKRWKEFLSNQVPRLGTNFFDVARYVMTEDIKQDVQKLDIDEVIQSSGLEDWRGIALREIISVNIAKVLQ